MSNLIQTALVVGVADLGSGAVASALAILWAHQTRPDFDRDMVFGLIKLCMSGAVVLFILSVMYIYSVKH